MFDEAESFIRERLEVWREVYGDDHDFVDQGTRRLAEILRLAGRIDEAETIESELVPDP